MSLHPVSKAGLVISVIIGKVWKTPVQLSAVPEALLSEFEKRNPLREVRWIGWPPDVFSHSLFLPWFHVCITQGDSAVSLEPADESQHYVQELGWISWTKLSSHWVWKLNSASGLANLPAPRPGWYSCSADWCDSLSLGWASLGYLQMVLPKVVQVVWVFFVFFPWEVKKGNNKFIFPAIHTWRTVIFYTPGKEPNGSSSLCPFRGPWERNP